MLGFQPISTIYILHIDDISHQVNDSVSQTDSGFLFRLCARLRRAISHFRRIWWAETTEKFTKLHDCDIVEMYHFQQLPRL